jgi:hypothetical protein
MKLSTDEVELEPEMDQDPFGLTSGPDSLEFSDKPDSGKQLPLDNQFETGQPVKAGASPTLLDFESSEKAETRVLKSSTDLEDPLLVPAL